MMHMNRSKSQGMEFCGFSFAKIFNFGSLLPQETDLAFQAEKSSHFAETLQLKDVTDPDRQAKNDIIAKI